MATFGRPTMSTSSSGVALADVQARLEAKGIRTTLIRGDVLEGDFPCLKGKIDGIRFDVLPELGPVAWEGAPEFKIGRVPLRVVDLPGLLALKFRAQGPQDLLDAAALVLLHPESRTSRAWSWRRSIGSRTGFRASSGIKRFRSQVKDAQR